MNKKEKISYLITPVFIGVCLIITGTIITIKLPTQLNGTIMTCTGLICIVLSLIMDLLLKLNNKN
jgi:hypothetical protein